MSRGQPEVGCIFIAESTLEAHLVRRRTRLGVVSTPQAVYVAFKRGIVE
jgi:hypothetical protein